MVEIEQIEEWKGQDVVDRDGEKIGKLEDVYFEAGSRDAVFGCVKSGMFGRRHLLVPLAGASVSRELNRHLRVSVEARYDRVKGTEEVFSLAALDSKTLSGKAEARYRLGPTVNASLRYVYLQRTTTRVDYRENVAMLGLTKTF